MNTTIISGRLVRNPGYNEVENEKGLHKIAKFVLAVRRSQFHSGKGFCKESRICQRLSDAGNEGHGGRRDCHR